MGILKAEEMGADLLMATDPDSDRVGIAVRDLSGQFILLNGNQAASLLIYYLLEKWKANHKLTGREFIAKTIVTSELLSDMAAHYKVKSYDVLTGFKFIAELIRNLEGKEQFIGGTVTEVSGKGESQTRVNYFKGNEPSDWCTNIPTFRTIDLGVIYEGISVELKAYGNNVEKLFYVKPGAEPETIRVRIQGAKSLRRNETGELILNTDLSPVKFTKPIAYQEEGGRKEYVEVAYAIEGDAYGFAVGL